MKLSVAVHFAIAALLSSPTVAATRTLTFAPQDIVDIDGTYDRGGQIIKLLKSSSSVVAVTFRLPANYRKNSPVTVRAQLSSVDIACDVVVRPLIVKRSRIGRVGSSLDAGDGGASVAVSSIIPMPEFSKQHFVQKFKLKPAKVGPLFTQIAGDVISFTFERHGLSVDDGCPSDLLLHFVDVTYTTN